MPIISPTPGDVHVNAALTNVSLAYAQSEAGFVADKVFPNVPVAKQSDIYWVWPRGQWNTDDMKVRAPGAQTAGTNFPLSRAPYYAEVRGLHVPIPDQVMANADNPAGYDLAATNFVTRKAMINRETSWVGKYMVPEGNATATAPGSFNPADNLGGNSRFVFWSSAASTPIEDIRKAMTFVQLRSGGFRPNTFTMTRLVADVLFDHPEIIARVNAGQTPGGPALSNEAVIARILGLDRVLVMDGIVNAAKEGLTEANAFFGGKNALLSYAPATPQLMTPSAGYTFAWTGYLGATQNGTRIKRFYMVAEASTWVEVETAYDQNLTSAEMAFFFSNIIA
jgi:hypothetical protein